MAAANTVWWHSSPELREKLELFHANKAAFPKEGMAEAKSLQENILNRLRNQMKSMPQFKVKEFQYTGSIYEGLKIGQPDEFDIMVMIDASDLTESPSPTHPGFSFLTTGATTAYPRMVVGCQVSSDKAMNEFFGFLTKAITILNLQGMIRLRRHGPAVKMDIRHGSIYYSTDVVPAFQLANRNLYVAKSPKGGDPNLWRISTSLIEKNILNSTGGIQKPCVRILKAIAMIEPGFKLLNSYHIKTALLHLKDRSELQWGPADLGPRTMDFLRYLEICLENWMLPHIYVPQMNLLEGKQQIACKGLANRIKKLRSNQAEFYKLIQL